MLIGIWKNVDELEDSLSLPELMHIVESLRDREIRDRRFAAALKGVNLDDSGTSAKDKVEEMKRKTEALNNGMNETQFEFDDLGLDFEEED